MGLQTINNGQLYYVNIELPQNDIDPSVRLYVSANDESFEDNSLALTLTPSEGDGDAFREFMKQSTEVVKTIGQGVTIYSCLQTAVATFCMTPVGLEPATVGFCMAYFAEDPEIAENASACLSGVAANVAEIVGANDAFTGNMLNGIGVNDPPTILDMLTTILNATTEFMENFSRTPEQPLPGDNPPVPATDTEGSRNVDDDEDDKDGDNTQEDDQSNENNDNKNDDNQDNEEDDDKDDNNNIDPDPTPTPGPNTPDPDQGPRIILGDSGDDGNENDDDSDRSPASGNAPEEPEHEEPEHEAPEHEEPEHEEPEHEAPEHEAPEHEAPEHEAPEHEAPDRD